MKSKDYVSKKNEEYVKELPEFLHVFEVLEFGRKKYGGDGTNWLVPGAVRMGHKDTHDSMFHHLAESFSDRLTRDGESGLDPLLHLACRALMEHTRRERHISDQDSMEVIYETMKALANPEQSLEELAPESVKEILDPDLLYYLASPYTAKEGGAKTRKAIEKQRLHEVNRLAIRLIKEQGLDLILPITSSAVLRSLDSELGGTWASWKKTDTNLVKHADVLLVASMPGYETSEGVQAEIQIAIENNKPVLMIDSLTLAVWRY